MKQRTKIKEEIKGSTEKKIGIKKGKKFGIKAEISMMEYVRKIINIKNIEIHKNHVTLAFILLFSFGLNFLAISYNGYGNEYYAAAVRSMTMNLRNFFFISFDPSGLVSIDKPPLGLWIQAIFALLFGYHGWAILLPQAIAGTLSCYLLYDLVKKYFDEKAGLISALVFAVTPIVVATARNNTMDMQLVFVLLLATKFLFQSIEEEKTGKLVLAGIMIGLGFNIKMLQAYLVIPSFVIVYLVYSKEKVYKRYLTGLISIIVMVIVSLTWVTIVELTPSDKRPYVDSTSKNSMYELILEHNGTERIFGRDSSNQQLDNRWTSLFKEMKGEGVGEIEVKEGNDKEDGLSTLNNSMLTNASKSQKKVVTSTKSSVITDNIGEPSMVRMWSSMLYGQISWLLIFCGFVLLYYFANRLKKTIEYTKMQRVSMSYWGIWLIVMVFFFSFAGYFHRYYLCMIAPAIAALTGIGFTQLIERCKHREKITMGYLITSIVMTVVCQMYYVWEYEQLRYWLVPLMILCILVFLTGMVLWYRTFEIKWVKFISLFGITVMLLAPMYWSLTPIFYVPYQAKPCAGPELRDHNSGSLLYHSKNTLHMNKTLENYLLEHYQEGSYLITATRSTDIAAFIIDTGLPVYAYGGYLGKDSSISLEEFKKEVESGRIRYFLLEKLGENNEITNYVKEYGVLVNPFGEGNHSMEFMNGGSLYRLE